MTATGNWTEDLHKMAECRPLDQDPRRWRHHQHRSAMVPEVAAFSLAVGRTEGWGMFNEVLQDVAFY